jgi:hypothetical protein
MARSSSRASRSRCGRRGRTHTTGVVEFLNRATVTIATGFDIVKHTHPKLEIDGLEGTMITPDSNDFTGPVGLFRRGGSGWQDVALDRSGRPHRASARLSFHPIEIMTAMAASGELLRAAGAGPAAAGPESIRLMQD